MATERPVSIRLRERDRRISVNVPVPPGKEGFAVLDADGREHHFGCGGLRSGGIFTHVASYTESGREPFFWPDDLRETVGGGRVVEPRFGPRLSPLIRVALGHLAKICSQHKGFHLDEKVWAVRTFRALRLEAREPFDPAEVEVWAATHGWSLGDARDLRDIAQAEIDGKRLRDYSRRPIRLDSDQARRMVEQWRRELPEAA